MEALGVDRNAKSRALRQLQENGLISIKQDRGTDTPMVPSPGIPPSAVFGRTGRH